MIKLIATALLLISSTIFAQTNKKMNLKELHKDTIGVQTNMMFPAKEGKVISLQISKNKVLKEHVSPVSALLVCVTGRGIYEDENGTKLKLISGDFVQIEANVKHQIKAIKDSNFLLIK